MHLRIRRVEQLDDVCCAGECVASEELAIFELLACLSAAQRSAPLISNNRISPQNRQAPSKHPRAPLQLERRKAQDRTVFGAQVEYSSRRTSARFGSPRLMETLKHTHLPALPPKHAHDVPHVRPPVLGRPHHFTTEAIDAPDLSLEGGDAAAAAEVVALRRYQSLAAYG